MHVHYSFLNDESALTEIRKHKWIESQKAGREIGFVTAALDWIKKYGHEWHLYRLRNEEASPRTICSRCKMSQAYS